MRTLCARHSTVADAAVDTAAHSVDTRERNSAMDGGDTSAAVDDSEREDASVDHDDANDEAMAGGERRKRESVHYYVTRKRGVQALIRGKKPQAAVI